MAYSIYSRCLLIIVLLLISVGISAAINYEQKDYEMKVFKPFSESEVFSNNTLQGNVRKEDTYQGYYSWGKQAVKDVIFTDDVAQGFNYPEIRQPFMAQIGNKFFLVLIIGLTCFIVVKIIRFFL